MSNNWTATKALRQIGLRLLPPQDCLLCGAAAGAEMLCEPCNRSLPLLDDPQCPRCALPVPSGSVCGQCLAQPPHYDATVARWRYGFPLDRLVHALKYAHRLAVADFFARALQELSPPAADLLIPLPLSPQRLAERGFNQAVELARPLARRWDIPLSLDGCLRVADTVAQATLPWKKRRRNVRHAFECRIDLSGKRIAVIDDVMTTGATLDEFARTLKNHGAAHVANWVCARALKP
ncbi:MAG: ComF family protein [Rhodocyclaceae bacterium]|nr:ComF family protein [Rhodocyclaceae bacterium]